MSDRFKRGLQALASRGLNLVAVLSREETRGAQWATNNLPVNYQTLILIAAGGKSMWQNFRTSRPRSRHPVDDFSRIAAHRAAAIWRLPNWRLLYPGADSKAPLQALGRAAGWHHESPLGLGIHPNYGPWFAYRALLATDARLPRSETQRHRAPCDRCITKPCLSACPAGALTADTPPDIAACSAFRLQPASACAERCLARQACPVGKAHAYEAEQLSYHYRRSLATIAGDPVEPR